MIPPSDTWSLNTSRIGRQVLVYDQLASTNTTAAELAVLENNDGLAVIARHQTSGRGQYGRVWRSEPGSSLLMSIVLNPPHELRRPAVLTALAAVAVSEAIATITGIQARIKWPNDLLLRNKKVCGILIEQHGSSAIIGIGLNLNQTMVDFTTATLPDATSLAMEAGLQFNLQTVAGTVLYQLDREYTRLLGDEREVIESNWSWRIGLIGQDVSVELMDGSIQSGRLLEMDFNKLELARVDGIIQELVPETVRHIVVV
jgi:BirA family biotin operon repressor/biotin-[acetyl-CoA-carboxylase] ligase